MPVFKTLSHFQWAELFKGGVTHTQHNKSDNAFSMGTQMFAEIRSSLSMP